MLARSPQHRLLALADPTRRALLAGSRRARRRWRSWPRRSTCRSRRSPPDLKVLEQAGLIRAAAGRPPALSHLQAEPAHQRDRAAVHLPGVLAGRATTARRAARGDAGQRRSEGSDTMSETTFIAEPGTPQLTMEREFDAPRELLFRAYTEPELVEQWLGPRRLGMRVGRSSRAPAAHWRSIHTDEDGAEYAFRGVFHGDPSARARDRPDVGVRGRARPRRARDADVRGARREDARTRERRLPAVEAATRTSPDGMEGGARESYEPLAELRERCRARPRSRSAGAPARWPRLSSWPRPRRASPTSASPHARRRARSRR